MALLTSSIHLFYLNLLFILAILAHLLKYIAHNRVTSTELLCNFRYDEDIRNLKIYSDTSLIVCFTIPVGSLK